MVPNVIERVWVQGTTTKVESLRGTAFTEEDGAHTFRIAGVDASGETVPLSGTVLAKILRADNITIDVSGTITDGVASVTMVGDCYHVPGRFSIVVYLSDGVTTIAIYAAVGDIYRATSDTELDSGTTVPSLVQLEAAYQNALSAASAANTAATGAERVNVSMSKSGDTITFSATDRTGATTTETMSDQSEEVADLESDVTDLENNVANLNSAISEYDDEFKEDAWVAKKMETSATLAIETYADRSVQTSGNNMLTLNTTSGYYSYCFVAPADIVISAPAFAGYYAIATLENPTTDEWRDNSGTLYKIGTSPSRYRSNDNNLPTHESPLTIDAGTQVVITVNSADVPNIDVFMTKFINVATTEDVEDAIDELLDVKEVFVGCNLDNTTKLSIDKRTGYSGSTSTIAGYPAVQLDASQSYNSYVFTPTEEIKIAGMPEENTYYAITTLANPNYSSWQTSGTTLWNNGSGASRVRKSENNLPTESSPLTISAGTIVVVTVKAGEVANLLIEETVKNSIKEPLMGEASPYIDVEMHNGYFYYYIPTRSGKYLRYKFVHFVDAQTNADGWVQRVVDLVPPNKVGLLMSVVRDGEWEMAIMLKDRPDFIGTMNHGSEIATIANLYFDGVKTTVTSGTKLSCKEIRVNQKSTMYDPNDETTVVGYHYKTHIITANEVRIEQRIEWITDQTLGISYCGMLPATRGNDYTSSVQVTDRAYDNKTYTEYDCSTTSFDPYLSAFTDKGNVFYLRGETSGISMSLECNMENASVAFTFLSNAVYYNKIYFAHNNVDYQVSNGDEWKWVSKYKIEYSGS